MVFLAPVQERSGNILGFFIQEKSEENKMQAVQKLIQIAKNEVGYLEKRSNKQLDDKNI